MSLTPPRGFECAYRIPVVGPGEREIGFEQMYAEAGADLRAVPWAALSPHRALVDWLDRQAAPCDQGALVVGCGFGDDAEELAGRGYAVTAFDVARTAIARCRQRFPGSSVDYVVADLFALPAAWLGRFDLVVEIRTLQSLPLSRRREAACAIAGTVGPEGRLWLRCLGREDGAPVSRPPWPVSRQELDDFSRCGLRELRFLAEPVAPDQSTSFTVLYTRD